jgi:hypothetical protein
MLCMKAPQIYMNDLTNNSYTEMETFNFSFRWRYLSLRNQQTCLTRDCASWWKNTSPLELWMKLLVIFFFHIQWSLVNPDAINPDASLSGRYFWGTNYMKIYSNVIYLSGRFVYLDDFAGNQSVRINEARL